MRAVSTIVKEALLVGLVMVIVFGLVHVPLMSYNPDWAMSHTGLAINVFIAAAVFHMGFEYFGLNKAFCDML